MAPPTLELEATTCEITVTHLPLSHLVVTTMKLRSLADYHGFKNLLEKTPKSIKKFVLVSSVGVESYNSFPYK